MATATLSDWLAADEIELVDSEENEYELDGEVYVVPPEVQAAGGRVENTEETANAADELAAIVEDAYEELKTNYPENWEEFFGFTEVTVIDDR